MHMEITASANTVRISTRKARLVADMIRNMSVEQALGVLRITHKRPTGVFEKVIESAIANAVNNAKISRDSLRIAQIIVNEGPALKRFHPSTRGRIHPYKRRSSHIRIVLTEGAKN
jgi:large subunit ribosomal protein L22